LGSQLCPWGISLSLTWSPGDVYLQIKNLREFVDWLWVFMSHRVGRRRGAR
jgi:hypothetical protein